MGRLIDLKGRRFERLIVTERAGRNKQGNMKWLCICDCGNVTRARGTDLRKGRIKSCGCLRTERRIKHGLYGHPAYRSWEGMKSRCYNQKNPDFARYGGRGITVCDEWKDDPTAFCKWAVDNGWIAGLTVHRVDRDGAYRPDNCILLPRAQHNHKDRRGPRLPIGVDMCGCRYRARRNIDGRTKYLGVFDTAEAAGEAYKNA